MEDKPTVVLMIEDNAGDVLLAQTMLADRAGMPCTVESAECLAAGLSRLSAGGIDIVLLDLNLPDSIGLDTLRTLLVKTVSSVAVVVLSGLGDEEIGAQAVQEGAQDYLVKGELSAGLLQRSIRYAMQRHQAERELRHARAHLEEQVQERTATLARTVDALVKENRQREHAERQILELNRDLERRVAERTAALEQANKELETFSYSISHDLRAPLRAISGFSQMLRQNCECTLGVQGKHQLDLVSQAAVRMGRMIDDILAFSRMARSAVGLESVDMTTLVQQIFAELNATPQVRFAVGTMPPAMCDRRMIRQLWRNLLDNALKYTSRNAEPMIEVSGGVSGSGGTGELIYQVKDNGAGFDMRYASKLFGLFQRLHAESEFEGSGLGLAIVRRIVERHGGRVWGEGRVGQGATFSFAIPSPPPLSS